MKRDGDIASMFRKHAAKKRASVSSPVVEEQNQEQEHLEERVIEEVVGPTPTPPPSVEPVEDVLPFLLHQGLAFRGHDESQESSNRGNFIELLKFLAANSEEVNKFVLNKK